MAVTQIEEVVVSTLRSMDQVADVYILPKGETLCVFTIVDQDDEDLYDQIYNQERSLIRQFRDVHFDFNVIARRGRSIAEIVGSDVPVTQGSESPDLCPNATNT